MKFREHRGGLAEAMETVVEIEDLAHLEQHIRELLAPWGLSAEAGSLKIEPYGFDDRINWDTYIVSLDGYGVLGFTDGLPT